MKDQDEDEEKGHEEIDLNEEEEAAIEKAWQGIERDGWQNADDEEEESDEEE